VEKIKWCIYLPLSQAVETQGPHGLPELKYQGILLSVFSQGSGTGRGTFYSQFFREERSYGNREKNCRR